MHLGFERLRQKDMPASTPEPLTFTPNPAFNDYLKIHKVLVGQQTAKELIRLGQSLSQETLPQYNIAAGSAFCEAALALDDEDAVDRMHLLDDAEDVWSRALDTQLAYAESNPNMVDYADPYRTALDLARLPLLRGIVAGDVTQHTRDQVRQETLAIAGANNVRTRLAIMDRDREAVASHLGLGHEANFLIAIDSLDSPTFVATSSFARSDTGHFHPHQTHDIMLFQQKWGRILDIMPVEIKAKTSRKSKNRYSALLVRGKVHLTYNVGIHDPENVRRAFVGYHLGIPSQQETKVARDIRTTLLEMIHLYKSGQALGSIATDRSLLRFRDQSALHDHHPEIAGDRVLAK